MELKHLRAFVALAEELHFSRAAARLHIVQPALSAQIRVLEDDLGAQLFERDKHKVSMTEEGRLLLPEALATLQQAARARDVVKHSAAGEAGQVRIAFVSSVLAELLPRLLRAMKEQLPRIELEFKDLPSPLQLDALHDNRLDFGLVRLPLPHVGLQARMLFEEKLVVAMPADDRLSRKRLLQPADLLGRPIFVLARKFAPGLYDQMLVSLHRRKITLDIARELSEYSTVLALAASGEGLGLVPEMAAQALPPGVVTRPLALAMSGAGIGVAWKALDTPRKQAFMRVLDALYPPDQG